MSKYVCAFFTLQCGLCCGIYLFEQDYLYLASILMQHRLQMHVHFIKGMSVYVVEFSNHDMHFQTVSIKQPVCSLFA
jgi:hypothetical protein